MLTIYRFPTLYRLAMRVGYGADAEARYPLVADLVADRTDQPGHILELCCGDLALYRHLLRRGLARSYLGLEQSSAMLRLARRRGVDVRAFDVRAAGELPTADTVIMQASLYQFHDIADTLLPRPWAAARRLLVIAEPVRNVSRSRVRAARWIARILTRTDGRVPHLPLYRGDAARPRSAVRHPARRFDRTPSA